MDLHAAANKQPTFSGTQKRKDENNRDWLQPPSVAALLRLLIATWLISKFVCYNVWMGDRLFPLVPVHDSFLNLPLYIHPVLFWLSVTAMLFCIARPGKKTALIIIGLEIISCLLDQNRWQPWEYQFVCMLAAFVCYKKEAAVITGWQLIMTGIYFFSGLSKLQPAFIYNVWNNLLLAEWLGIRATEIWQYRWGYSLPLMEMGAALLLFFVRTRKLAVLMLAAMHIFILLLLGPFGLQQNSAVWAWNIGMLLLLPALFWKRSFCFTSGFFKPVFSWLLLACFVLLPWLNLLGRWDHYLSFTLYSGAAQQLYICAATQDGLPAGLALEKNWRSNDPNCPYQLNVYQWAMAEMNVPPYPQKRVFRSIAKQWQQKNPGKVFKFYVYKSGFKKEWREL